MKDKVKNLFGRYFPNNNSTITKVGDRFEVTGVDLDPEAGDDKYQLKKVKKGWSLSGHMVLLMILISPFVYSFSIMWVVRSLQSVQHAIITLYLFFHGGPQ